MKNESVGENLKNVNFNLDLSCENLSNFSRNLFYIARCMDHSFEDASKAALELSRQGLGIAILTGGIGLEVSTSTESINKLANVDAAFTVSSSDLVEGLKRVKKSANEASLQIDNLINLIKK